MSGPQHPIRVMVVDDSAVVRGMLARIVDAEADMRVVSSAWTGRAALDILKRKAADIVLLDVEMPEMDGLTALPLILDEHPGTRIIMVSTLTERGAKTTVKALSLGAADYVAKPRAKGGAGLESVRNELLEKIRALAGRGRPPVVGASKVSAPTVPPASWAAPPPPPSATPRVLGIASSTGGPNALSTVLAALPADFPLPILIVQHMPPLFTEMLAQRLERTAGRPCTEAVDGERMEPGHTYIAPGDRHLFVESSGGRTLVRLSDHPPENFCRPSADPLFRSLADLFGPALLGLVLTGMGQDGLEGCRRVRDAGGTILVQDEETSVVWGMPGAVANAGLAHAVLPLEEIATTISDALQVAR